jgi:hypothetical protein
MIAGAGCARSDDPTIPQPDKVYRDGFETPLDAVRIAGHGGTIIGAYDAWLLLAGEPLPQPRDDADYRPIECDPIAQYLAREQGLSAAPGEAFVPTDCRQATNERLPFENGRWLARAQSGDRLFYRVWKYR